MRRKGIEERERGKGKGGVEEQGKKGKKERGRSKEHAVGLRKRKGSIRR